jgi:hypothetical protein
MFRWRIKPGSTAVTVVGPDRVRQWPRDKPAEADRTVGVNLHELGPPGRYQVTYRGISLRGHPFRGTMDFVLAEPERTDPGYHLPLGWIVAVTVLTAGGAAVGVRLGRPDR